MPLSRILRCRSCESEDLTEFLDLGKQYLADFRADNKKPKKYPLLSVICESCKLVQLAHSVPQKEMYHERYGFKSGISDSIIIDLDDIVTHAFQWCNDPKSWLDIASNDGTLLSFVPTDIYRVGVDPVKFLCDEATPNADLIINNYFNSAVAWTLGYNNQKFDVITSISCFYDMPEPAQFVVDVKSLLSPRGVWVIQQNYLLTTMQLGAVDNICHEHLEYYTLYSLEKLLERFGLEVIEVTTSMVNGGSIRTIVAHKDKFEVDESVYKQRLIEQDYGVDQLGTYQDFANNIGVELNKLRTLVNTLKTEGKTISIISASTRGATIWQSIGLSASEIEYAVERNPAKVGKMFSAIGVPIISEEEFKANPTDYAIIGPWFFQNEIIKRYKDYGCKLIVPLPKVRIND